MRKILSLILCLMMVCIAAVSLADDNLIPSIKIQRQMQNDGNGVKGSFQIQSNASLTEQPFIAAIQNAEFDILRNASEDKWHLVVFQKDEAGQQINKSELYQEASGLYLRSDFLPERVYRFPGALDLIPESFTGTGENPSILPVIVSLASMSGPEKSRWEPVLQKYSNMVETWLAGFATAPELQRNPDGTTQMKLIYIVPAADIRAEIITLVKTAAEDPEMVTLLASVLTDEQRAVYLNGGLEYYYTDVLNGVDFSGEIRFEKDVSTMGEMISSSITLPLDPAVTGYRTLAIYSGNGQTGYTLTGNDDVIRLVIPDGLAEFTGQQSFEGTGYILRYSSAADQKDGNLAVKLDVVKTFETYSDEETGKIHEIHHYKISAVRDTTDLPEGITDADFSAFEAINIDADFHFSAKAPQSSPVTLESSVSYQQGEFSVLISGKIKTAATWAFVPFSIENAKQLNGITAEEIGTSLAEFVQNASANIRRIEKTEGETGE